LLKIHREDHQNVLAAFFTLFGAMMGHAMLETARDALFLSRLPASRLPIAYLAIAGLAVLAARINRHCATVYRGRVLLSSSLLLAAAVNAAMWLLSGAQSSATLYVFYVWTGLLATVVVVQFWLLLSDAYTVSQAKRLYALIGAGGLLGATCGALAAASLLQKVDARDLILFASAAFAVSALGPRYISGGERDAPPRSVPADESPTRGGLAFLRGHPYLRRLALLVLLSTITVTLADYVFKATVAARVEPDELGTFFGQFYASLNAVALLVQLSLAPWLLRNAGVNRTLSVMPGLLLVAAVGFLAAPGLAVALVLKGIDGSLRHSVHRTSSELLYVPLPGEIRHRFKAFIDSVGQRGGQAVASIAILGAISVGAATEHLAAAVAVLAGAWLTAVYGIKRHYLELFRQQLRGGTIDLRASVPELDLHQLETLMSALNSADDAQVIGSLDLLDQHNKLNVIPALILYHPSHEVVLRALELFSKAGRRDFATIAQRLLAGDNNEVRAAAVRAISAVAPDEPRLRQLLRDRSTRVRATALVALMTNGFAGAEDAEHAVRHIIADGAMGARRALARAIRYQPDDRLAWILLELARIDDRPLQLEVALAITAQPHPRFLPALLSMLAVRSLRVAARQAFVAIGPAALDFLDQSLANPTLELAIRRHIPRTISRFQSAKAAAILLAHLSDSGDGMTRFKILRGLGRIKTNNPRIFLDNRILREAAYSTLQRIITLIHWRRTMDLKTAAEPAYATRGAELLISLFREKERNATERLFRLLDLLRPKENFQLVYHGLRSPNPKTRASSRELLEHLVEPAIREPVLALADEIGDDQRLARMRGFHSPADLSYRGLLRELLEDSSEAVRSIAAYHIGEIGLDDLRDELMASRPKHASYLRDVVEHALSVLGIARPEVTRA
jgi:ATP:ADP antiporter, AAA family